MAIRLLSLDCEKWILKGENQCLPQFTAYWPHDWMRHENDVTSEFKCKFYKHLRSSNLVTIAKFDEIVKIGGCTQLLKPLNQSFEYAFNYMVKIYDMWVVITKTIIVQFFTAFSLRLHRYRTGQGQQSVPSGIKSQEYHSGAGAGTSAG